MTDLWKIYEDGAALDRSDVLPETEACGWKPRWPTGDSGVDAPKRRRQTFRQDRGGGFERNGPFDDVFEFSNIARPVVFGECLYEVRVRAKQVSRGFMFVLLKEIIDESRQIFNPLAGGRGIDS